MTTSRSAEPPVVGGFEPRAARAALSLPTREPARDAPVCRIE